MSTTAVCTVDTRRKKAKPPGRTFAARQCKVGGLTPAPPTRLDDPCPICTAESPHPPPFALHPSILHPDQGQGRGPAHSDLEEAVAPAAPAAAEASPIMSDGVYHRKSNGSGSGSPDVEKSAGHTHEFPDTHTHIRGIETSAETSLHRGLKSRHITMIAIGGALGTGLIIGTGKALAQAGPGSLFISYTFMGALVYVVMAAMGEMAAWLPLSAGFAGYATRYCHPSLGFTLGWTYWMKYIIVTPNQLTAAAIAIQFWVPRETLNPGVFISIFLVAIICINYFGGIKFFGEFEFWLSSFKVITIVGVILFSLCIACGAGPAHRAKGFVPGFYTWENPGAFAETLGQKGALGRFLGFWSVMVNATFAYLGTELVGVTAAEAASRKSIPKAIKLTFYRILFFYILSVLLVGMIVPYNHPKLAFANKNASGNANASPFVVAAEIAGVEVLPHILNVCICLFVFSASNSDLYIASRTLYGLASDEAAPAIFKRTDSRGVPYPALALCSLFALLALMNVSDDSRKVFGYFVNLTTIFGILTWIFILVTHLFFLRARKAQGITNDQVSYRSPVGYWGTAIGLFFTVLVALTKNFSAFIEQNGRKFDYETFITGYIGIPIAFILFFGHKFYTKSSFIKAHEVDFYTGKDVIERQFDEYEALEREKKTNATSGWSKIYYRYIAWLF
ncbi:dicarboxylic amino acid permease [Paramyrothecium foliicola]|nr:dicarboxylic amino acid permease [Paramyrothecium foliicola]